MLRPCCVRSRSAPRRGAVDRARGAAPSFGSIGTGRRISRFLDTRRVRESLFGGGARGVRRRSRGGRGGWWERRGNSFVRGGDRGDRRSLRGGDRGDRRSFRRDRRLPSPRLSLRLHLPAWRDTSSWASDQTFRALDDSQIRRKERAAMAAAFAAASALAASEEKENEALSRGGAASAGGGDSFEHLASPHRRQVRGIDRRFRDVTSRVFPPRVRGGGARGARRGEAREDDAAPARGSQDAVSRRCSPRRTPLERRSTGTGTPSNASSFRNGCCARAGSSREAKLSEREEERERVLRRERESLRRRADDRLAFVSGRSPDALAGQLGGSSHRELLPPEDRSHVEGTSRPAAAPLAVPPRVPRARDVLLRGSIGASPGSDPALPPRDGPRRNPKVTSAASLSFSPRRFSDADTLARIQPEAPPRPRPRGFARRNARFNANAPIFVDWREGSRNRNSTRSSRKPSRALQTSQSAVGRDGVERRDERPRRTPNGSAPVLGWCRRRRGGRDPIVVGEKAAAPEEVPRRRRRRMIVSLVFVRTRSWCFSSGVWTRRRICSTWCSNPRPRRRRFPRRRPSETKRRGDFAPSSRRR